MSNSVPLPTQLCVVYRHICRISSDPVSPVRTGMNKYVRLGQIGGSGFYTNLEDAKGCLEGIRTTLSGQRVDAPGDLFNTAYLKDDTGCVYIENNICIFKCFYDSEHQVLGLIEKVYEKKIFE